MYKKILIFICILGIFLCFHACDIPEAVEIIMNPDFTMSVNSGNLSDIIEKNIREAMTKSSDSNDMALFRYNGYRLPNSNKEVQTFLIQYDIMKDHTIAFFDDFDAVMNEFDGMDLDPEEMSTEISLKSLTSFADNIEPIETDLNLRKILDDAEEVINTTIEWDLVAPILLGLKQGLEEKEYTLPSDGKKIKIEDLDTITFANNVTFKIDLKVILDDSLLPNANISNVNFTIKSIEIRDGGTPIPSKNNAHTVFNGANAINNEIIETVYFDLSGRTLNSEFIIVITDIEDNTIVATDVHLETSGGRIYTNVTGAPLIRGIEGFVIKLDPNDPNDELTEVNIKADIDLDFDDSKFIHAEVKNGTINFEFDLPDDPNGTWIHLENDVIKDIYLLQNESEEDLDGNKHPGLSDLTGNTGNLNLEWHLSGSGSLNGKHINNKNIKILDKSKITVPEGKISFMLSNNDLDGHIQVFVVPKINIESFTIVHINADDIINIPKLKPIDLRGLTEGLHWLKFDKVGIELEFGRIDLPNYKIRVIEQNIGINMNPDEEQQYKPMSANSKAQFTELCQSGLTQHSPNPEDVCSECYHWEIDKNNDSLLFEFDIKKTDNNNVLIITDLDAEKEAIHFEVTAVNIFFKEHWTYAEIDFSTKQEDMNDSFPGENEDAIDLASYFEILQGFTFNNIDSYLYLEGPDRFFNINPEITMLAKYGDNTGPYLFTPDGDDTPGTSKFPPKELKRHILPNLDPQGNGKFSGELIKGAPVRFDRIVDDLPNNLRIEYLIEFHEGLIVTPEQVAGNAGDTINITMIIVLPMSLTAGEHARFEIPNFFKGKEDIFDRKNQGDASLLDIIRRLNLNLHFSGDVFNGGELYLKRPDIYEVYGEELLKFPLSSRNLSIPITGQILEIINIEYPFKIEEMGVRFESGSLLDIPDDFKILQMDFDSDLRYEHTF